MMQQESGFDVECLAGFPLFADNAATNPNARSEADEVNRAIQGGPDEVWVPKAHTTLLARQTFCDNQTNKEGWMSLRDPDFVWATLLQRRRRRWRNVFFFARLRL
jgi:hypothetical protein